MRSTDSNSITLPPETIKLIRAKVASGAYESEADVINQALHALEPQEQALERWLREEVVPACDELQKDPSRGLTADQVRQTLANEYKKSLKAG